MYDNFESLKPGVSNLYLVVGQTQTLQDMAGRTNFQPTIPFILLFMMLTLLGNFCHSIRLTPDFHSS